MVPILSQSTGPQVTVTLFSDAAPCPRAEVLVTGLEPNVASVTVYRLAAGREFTVRGAVSAPTAGALTRIDFEIPFGLDVTYRAEFFDSSGVSLGYVSSNPVRLDVAETWLHNPLNPQGATPVHVEFETAAVLSRPVPGVVSRPIGRRLGVVLASPRSGVVGMTFNVHATSLETADRVQAMIGGYGRDLPPVLCVRIAAGMPMRVPRPLFLGVLDIQEEDLTIKYGGEDTVHRMQGDEVAPPVSGLFVPLLTRADLNRYYATRAALNDDNLTRLAVNRRYDVAGYANQ